MYSPESLFSQAGPDRLMGRILQFPLTRIVIAALFLVPYLILHNRIVADWLAAYREPLRIVLVYADALLSIGILFGIYHLYTRWVEKRKAHELSFRNSLLEIGAGFLVSALLVGFMVSLCSIFGFYRIVQVNESRILLDALFRFGIGSFIQVLFFRLIVFRLAEELLGTWLAVVGTAVLFGIAHAGNENATLWTTIALILGDLLLLGAFIYTRRLWLVWGIHWGWNFCQDGVFGLPNSGISSFDSWLDSTLQGPEWLTGGAFGIEASLVVVALSVLIGAVFLKRAGDSRRLVLPLWARARA